MPNTAARHLLFPFALIVALVCMGAPLLAVFLLHAQGVTPGSSPEEVTVGIALIVRVTFRRLFRAAARNIFRTTFSTIGRASARTFTRRFTRFIVRMLFGIAAKQVGANIEEKSQDGEPEVTEFQAPWKSALAIGLSFVVLSLSFWGVLYLLGSQLAAESTTGRGIPMWLACAAAGFPIIAHGTITYLLARSTNTPVRFTAEFDAILLQGYFTGAGSFLPMTTDMTYGGQPEQKSRLAITSLLSMYGIHWVLFLAAQSIGGDVAWGSVNAKSLLELSSAMFILYPFVYVFPIAPLEGHHIWSNSKLTWLFVAAPILLSFLANLPDWVSPML